MVSQGVSLTLLFLLATLIALGEANNNRKLLESHTNYQPLHSPLPSPIHSPNQLDPPRPQGYKTFFYRKAPSPPSRKPWWWLLWSLKTLSKNLSNINKYFSFKYWLHCLLSNIFFSIYIYSFVYQSFSLNCIFIMYVFFLTYIHSIYLHY